MLLEQVRSSGFGLLNSVGRVSSFVSIFAAGHLLKVSLWAPLLLSSVLLGIGSLAMMQLPVTVEQPLEDMLAHHNVGGGLVTVCLGLRAKGGRRTHENGVGGDGSDAELTGLLSLTAE